MTHNVDKNPTNELSRVSCERSDATVALGTSLFGTAGSEGWCIEKSGARELFMHFVAADGRTIDASDIYHDGEAERWIGEFVDSSGIPREEFVLSTKGGWNASRVPLDRYLEQSLDASLRRLNTDYVDVY